MSENSGQNQKPVSGDVLFAAFFLILSAYLVSQIPWQVQWFKGTKLFAQPAFWPVVSLAGMLIFALFHFATRFRRDDWGREWAEAAVWTRSVEYVVWFMIYVHAVPLIGYLLSTLIFAPVLAYRRGYRQPKTLLAAAGVGLLTVLFFKSFLPVKIPGGAIYEYLPNGLRSFMIINF